MMTMPRLLTLMLGTHLMAACSPKTDANSVPDTGTSPAEPTECETTYATVTGTVTSGMDWYQPGESIAHANVLAQPTDSPTETIGILSDENGVYTAEIPSGSYTFWSQSDGCQSDRTTVELIACVYKHIDFALIECLDGR